MRLYPLALLALLASTPADDDWEARAIAMFRTLHADLLRIDRDGLFTKADIETIRLAAAYARFKAERSSPALAQQDSLTRSLRAAEDGFYNRMRAYRSNLDRLATGARALPGDSAAITGMAQFMKAQLDMRDGQELRN